MKKASDGSYIEESVKNYGTCEILEPSNSHILLLELTSGEQVKNHQAFFVHMQKSSFEKDMADEKE